MLYYDIKLCPMPGMMGASEPEYCVCFRSAMTDVLYYYTEQNLVLGYWTKENAASFSKEEAEEVVRLVTEKYGQERQSA